MPKFGKVTFARDSETWTKHSVEVLEVRGLACPYCGKSGFVVLHGYLYGNQEENRLGRIKRGRRFFCSNRGRNLGCGRTFSYCPPTVIPRFCMGTKTLWQALLKLSNKLPVRTLFHNLSTGLSESTAIRLSARIQKIQSRIRVKLTSMDLAPPAQNGLTSALEETVRFLTAAFFESDEPISSYQLKFQESFLAA